MLSAKPGASYRSPLVALRVRWDAVTLSPLPSLVTCLCWQGEAVYLRLLPAPAAGDLRCHRATRRRLPARRANSV